MYKSTSAPWYTGISQFVNSSEYASRRDRTSAEFAGDGLDALLVSNPLNVRYLSGFTGDNSLLLLSPDRTVLLTDGRYRTQAAEETDCPAKIVQGPLLDAAAKLFRRGSKFRLGFEAAHVTVQKYNSFSSLLPAAVKLLPARDLIIEQRMVKSASEIEKIRRSAALTCKALSQALRSIRPGVKELEVAAEIDHRMRRLGAEAPAFETIVAFGERSAMPHARPGRKSLTAGEIVLIDMGAMLDGYASDMTRTLVAGRAGPKVRRLYKAVLEAQLTALAEVREGVTAAQVDRAARRPLRKAGLDGVFVHATGHGLGLEIHEPPRLGRKVATSLKAGMAITIEPGVYLQGFGGVRIEDTVVVTRNGCEILTPTSKELLEY